MDFFTRQETSKRSTRVLVVLFSLAFLSVGLASAIAIALVFNLLPDLGTPVLSTTVRAPGVPGLLAFLAVTAGTMLLMLLASLYRSATLAQGGGQVARMLGASEVRIDSADPLHRRLVNVVEEMSIASGLPVPDIFVLEHEPAINAFAAGLSPSNAAIAVTRGALERLNRAELQGVIAHEFSHILNGDMRINQRLVGYSFGILVLALAGRWMLRSARFARHSRNRGASPVLLLGVILAIIGAIGIFFSRLIKAAVSRQREALADASAVQFTREPSGLAGALKKIGGYTAFLSSVDSEEVAHMLFGPGAKAFRGLFATHPPLEERIKALDPSFNPSQYIKTEPLATGPEEAHEPRARALAAAAPVSNEAVIASAGTIEAPALGEALRTAIPEELYAAAHSRDSSPLLLIAMTLSAAEHARPRQIEFLTQRLGKDRTSRCSRLLEELGAMDESLWLPLLELTVPALKHRPDAELEFLLDVIEKLLAVDPAYELRKFVLPRILSAYLPGRPTSRRPRSDRKARLTAPASAERLLGTVAALGHANPEAAAAAYRAGIEAIRTKGLLGDTRARIDFRAKPDLELLDAALDRLARLPPPAKREVLRAVLATIRHDAHVEVEEIEVFRAIAATLAIPVPPLAVGAIVPMR